MVHLVLMKFRPGKLDNEVMQVFQETYTALKQELQGKILSVHLWRNCVVRDQNMDLLIQLELSAKEDLQTYLQHPRHKAMIQRYQPDLLSVVSFDREGTL